MASGINSTFRQVGIATGIATLGSIFAGQIRSTIIGPAGLDTARGASSSIENAVLNGESSRPGRRPPECRQRPISSTPWRLKASSPA